MSENYTWLYEVLLYPDLFIKYDYSLPEPSYIETWINDIINKMDVNKNIKQELKNQLDGRLYRDDESKTKLLMNCESIFGKEWFFGYGTLYRWRSGEINKAMKITKALKEEDFKHLDYIKKELREKQKIHFKL